MQLKIFQKDSERIFKDIISTFNLRHIFCHEVIDCQIDIVQIESCFNSVKIFLTVCDEYITNILEPDFLPLSQLDMNQQAHKEYNILKNKMNELIYQTEKIYEGEEKFLVPFRLSQVKWLEFVDLFINSRYPEQQDPRRYYGSIFPLEFFRNLV